MMVKTALRPGEAILVSTQTGSDYVLIGKPGGKIDTIRIVDGDPYGIYLDRVVTGFQPGKQLEIQYAEGVGVDLTSSTIIHWSPLL